LIEAGEKEISRKKDFEKTLDYVSQQLELLQVVRSLSDLEMNFPPVVNRATEVFAAVLKYIAKNIRQKSDLNWLKGTH